MTDLRPTGPIRIMIGNERRSPRAGRNHNAIGFVRPTVCLNEYSIRLRIVNCANRFARVDLRTGSLGHFEVALHTQIGE